MDSSEASICCWAARHCSATAVNWVAAEPRHASYKAFRLVYMPPTAFLICEIEVATAAEDDWIRSEST